MMGWPGGTEELSEGSPKSIAQGGREGQGCLNGGANERFQFQKCGRIWGLGEGLAAPGGDSAIRNRGRWLSRFKSQTIAAQTKQTMTRRRPKKKTAALCRTTTTTISWKGRKVKRRSPRSLTRQRGRRQRWDRQAKLSCQVVKPAAKASPKAEPKKASPKAEPKARSAKSVFFSTGAVFLRLGCRSGHSRRRRGK